jgi:hypothetical protein
MLNETSERHRKRAATPELAQDDAKRARSETDPFADLAELAERLYRGSPSELTAEITDEDLVNDAKSALRSHIGVGVGRGPGAIPIGFYLELSPYSSRRGASCQHPTCEERIQEGRYRFAVYPGMNNYYGRAGMTTTQEI